jgi:Ni/Fe-hydrogenase subunit HybB-like protein
MSVLVNRWNVTLSGLVVPPQWSPGVLGNLLVATYVPSLVEVAVAIGIAGYALLGFSLGVKYLPLYPGSESHAEHH